MRKKLIMISLISISLLLSTSIATANSIGISSDSFSQEIESNTDNSAESSTPTESIESNNHVEEAPIEVNEEPQVEIIEEETIVEVTPSQNVETPGYSNIQPSNQPPVAIFDYTPANPKVNEIMEFDATDSYDPDGTIAKYYWWWQNETLRELGAWADIVYGSQYVKINYSFATAGKYWIILCVVDNDGDSEDPISYCDHSFEVTDGKSAQSVFVNEDLFEVPGSYDVSLKVIDDDGDSDTIMKTIHHVMSPNPGSQQQNTQSGDTEILGKISIVFGNPLLVYHLF